MKKIIALLLIAVLCVGVMASCKKEEISVVDQVGAMYNNSEPTKIVAQTAMQFGDKTLNSSYVLTVGYVDGKVAATYESSEDVMNDVASGSGEQIVGPIGTKTETMWYLEGKGVSVNKANKWDSSAESFIPEKGAVAITLSSELIKDYTYEDNKLSFTVAAADTAKVFGEDLAVDADVFVEIVNDGAVVTSIALSYTLAANEAENVQQTSVTITVDYTYDLEQISFK